MDRVNQVVQEVLADELERINDERLELVTVTGVRVEPGLSHGVVWFSSLSQGDPEGVAVALGEHRIRFQAAIGRQLRLRGTPLLSFVPDPAITLGSRVEELLRGLHQGDLPRNEDDGS
ncbi:MAG: 30S ribosome-binding factor RbfA [Acidimicrobiales bacterium]